MAPKLGHKLDHLACGMGLAARLSPPEIAALNATYSYFAPGAQGVNVFVQEYWGFADIHDSRMTRGHQLVLAALHRYPWKPGNERRWEQIKRRAKLAADRLVEEGWLKADKLPEAYAQIEAARPFNASRRPDLSLYDTAFRVASREMGKLEGPDWKSTVRAITLTLHPDLQSAAQKTSSKAMAGLPEKYRGNAHPVVLFVDAKGHILAAYTDDAYTNRILKSPQSRGSLGKTLVMAGGAALGDRPDDGPTRPR